MTHIDEETLSEYALCAADDPEFTAVAKHLAACEECEARFRALTAFFGTLTEGGTWQAVEGFTEAADQENAVLA
ncbi:MAG: hypothetical protein ACRD3J_14695, partial [Thermoanaerobaculia bacterium]